MTKYTIFKISAIISGISGLIILFGVAYPIIKYEMYARQNFPLLISPLVNPLTSQILGSEAKDSTRVSNWFNNADFNFSNLNSSQAPLYHLSIPKLKIYDALVSLGGDDLSVSLIHFPGTALPGKPGNSVIFGHSVLPIFFNPKNYLTIFSNLPLLKTGDEIYLNYDSVLYRYQVESMFEIFPEDIQVLEQDGSDSFLTLVTCVPPGDPRMPRRLIVRARVIPFN